MNVPVKDLNRNPLRQYLAKLDEFNRWERRNQTAFTPEQALQLVFEQYDLMKTLGNSMDSPLNEQGIRRMNQIFARMSQGKRHEAT